VVAIVIASCSKSIKISKQLDGTWKVTEYKENGVSIDVDSAGFDDSYSITFEKCKVTKEDCPGSYTFTFDLLGVPTTFTENFTYSINEDGTEITLIFDDNGIITEDTATILEHSNSNFAIEDTDSNGNVTEIHYEKI